MSIQLRDIEYFAVIAEHRQIQRAAAALNLSQPALSKSVQRLEQAVGTNVLLRTPKGVELTQAGEALLRRVQGLRLALDAVTREVADLGEGLVGHLRLGTGPDLSAHLVPAACAHWLQEAPRATLQVTVGTADVLLPALSRGELDLTVTATPVIAYDEVMAEPLVDEEFVVFCSAKHRLARKKRIGLADLVQERWALAVTGGPSPQRDLHHIFAAQGLPAPRIAVESNSVPFRLHLLPATNLLAFLPKRAFQDSAARAHLVDLRIEGLSYRRTITVCHRKDAYLSPAARRLIDILKAHALQPIHHGRRYPKTDPDTPHMPAQGASARRADGLDPAAPTNVPKTLGTPS